MRYDDVDAAVLKLRDEGRHFLRCIVSVEAIECHRGRLGVTFSLKSVEHCRNKALGALLVAAAQEADPRRSCRLREVRGHHREP
jgi:hypothetical protein